MRWPWISALLGAVVILTPPAREILHDAFFASEAISRNIAQFLVYAGLAILVLMGLLEWLVRVLVSRRRARGATTT
jgi:hypothetical protein